MSDPTKQLVWALRHLAQLQYVKLDYRRLRSAIATQDLSQPPTAQLYQVCSHMGLDRPKTTPQPDPAQLPLLFYSDPIGWAVVCKRNANGTWKLRFGRKTRDLSDALVAQRCIAVNMQPAAMLASASASASALPGSLNRSKGFMRHIYEILWLFRGELFEGMFATLVIGFLSLATALFAMQVYDRAIPARSASILFIVASGVLLTILVELAMKYARSHIMDYVAVAMDKRLSREVFARLMHVPVDQLPPAVGTLAGQMRGYEQVRACYTASTLFTLVDLPLGLVFVLFLWVLASPWVAVVPLIAALAATALGLRVRSQILRQAHDAAAMSHLKTGLLVEAIEGIETIQAGSGGSKWLARWVSINGKTIKNDLNARHLTEGMAHWSAAMEHISYVLLVAAGAIAVMDGTMTLGALVACAMVGGRALAPVVAWPNVLVQYARAEAALAGLEKLYPLKIEHRAADRPVTPSQFEGRYAVTKVKFGYGDAPPAVVLPKLEIAAGERVAILGPIGAGKSTLMKLLSGMYRPQEGCVMLDDLDLRHMHCPVLGERVGYLQQEHRLLLGTLRENLLIGMTDPGDDAIAAALRRTGLDKIVSAHPKGLDRPIMEGGKGLSSGEKQLLAFTRVVLMSPAVLLLDEPTAALDDEQERRCLAVLAQEAQRNKTMVIVTHKPSVLPLVTRIIVMTGARIVLDGPRDQVLQKLQRSDAAVPPSDATAPSEDAPPPSATPTPTPAMPLIQITPPSQSAKAARPFTP